MPAPGGRAGPIARQKSGSIGSGKAPPALGLPAITMMRTARPIPTMPVSASRASVVIPTAKTTRAPRPASAHTLPGSAPRTGPMMTAPPMPPAIEYSAMTPVRITARCRLAGLVPALIARIEAQR